MKVLFLSIVDIPQNTMQRTGIYTDLLRKFKKEGHDVYVACGREKRHGSQEPDLSEDCGINVLHIGIGNITKTNYYEKGINTLLLPYRFKKAIKKFLNDVDFDLILYATPPVTICSVVEYVKKKTKAKTFLLLKDMWPEGISSLGVIKKNGLIYKYFQHKEQAMYDISDYIGCMSEKCVEYIIEHNSKVDKNKLCVCPNSLENIDLRISKEKKIKLKEKYNLSNESINIIYGGNLGKAQGIDFFIEGLKRIEGRSKVKFIVLGSGLEYNKLKQYVDNYQHTCIELRQFLPREEFDELTSACDIGLLLLNQTLTVPNIPSRMLDYMTTGLPVLAFTDKVSDVGKKIEEGTFGWFAFSDNTDNFVKLISVIENEIELFNIKGDNSFNYYQKYYTVDEAYKVIVSRIKS